MKTPCRQILLYYCIERGEAPSMGAWYLTDLSFCLGIQNHVLSDDAHSTGWWTWRSPSFVPTWQLAERRTTRACPVNSHHIWSRAINCHRLTSRYISKVQLKFEFRKSPRTYTSLKLRQDCRQNGLKMQIMSRESQCLSIWIRCRQKIHVLGFRFCSQGRRTTLQLNRHRTDRGWTHI